MAVALLTGVEGSKVTQKPGDTRGTDINRVDYPPTDQTATVIPSRRWIIQASLCVGPPDTWMNLLFVGTFDIDTHQLSTAADLVFHIIFVPL